MAADSPPPLGAASWSQIALFKACETLRPPSEGGPPQSYRGHDDDANGDVGASVLARVIAVVRRIRARFGHEAVATAIVHPCRVFDRSLSTTPLHEAAQYDTAVGAPILCYLLSLCPAGPVPSVAMDPGTPLEAAFKCASTDPKATGVRALLARGCDAFSTGSGIGERYVGLPWRAMIKNKVAMAAFDRHKERPWRIDHVPAAFIPLHTEEPAWRIKHIVALWSTRAWGSGASGGGAAHGAGDDAGASACAGHAASASTAFMGAVPSAAEAHRGGLRVSGAGPAAAIAAGLPDELVLLQSLPRGVVARVIELSSPLA